MKFAPFLQEELETGPKILRTLEYPNHDARHKSDDQILISEEVSQELRGHISWLNRLLLRKE